MARKPRIFAADIPYHIIQRGNNKQKIFFTDSDYLFFLETLVEAKKKHPCLLYGYCLMPNHFHLLAQPKEKENVSFLMKLVGAKYVRYFNKGYNRTGTLWESRFRCALIDSERYFTACLCYIETNPVRANIVASHEEYKWSSYRYRAYGEPNPVLDMDHVYESLGRNQEERRSNYRGLTKRSIPEQEIKLIREMTQKNSLIGSEEFKAEIEEKIGFSVSPKKSGRPKKLGKLGSDLYFPDFQTGRKI